MKSKSYKNTKSKVPSVKSFNRTVAKPKITADEKRKAIMNQMKQADPAGTVKDRYKDYKRSYLKKKK